MVLGNDINGQPVSCDIPSQAQAIANNLRNFDDSSGGCACCDTSITCNGLTWNVGSCTDGGVTGSGPTLEVHQSSWPLSCYCSYAALRPCWVRRIWRVGWSHLRFSANPDDHIHLVWRNMQPHPVPNTVSNYQQPNAVSNDFGAYRQPNYQQPNAVSDLVPDLVAHPCMLDLHSTLHRD